MNVLSEKELVLIFRLLFTKIKDGLAVNKYYTFPPESIEIRSGKNVHYKTREDAQNLRDCFRQLGVTMYHVVIGESECNVEQSIMDGYVYNCALLPEVIQSTVKTLLSGNACSVEFVEREFKNQNSVLRDFRKKSSLWCAEQLKRIMEKTRILLGKLYGVTGKANSYLVEHYNDVQTWVVWGFVVFAILEIFLMNHLRWYCTEGDVIIRDSFVFACVILLLMLYGGSNVSWFRSMRKLFLFWVCTTAACIIFAYQAFLWDPAFATGFLVERKTGKYVAVLSPDPPDPLKWRKKYIDHFKYEIIGLTLLPRNGFVRHVAQVNYKKIKTEIPLLVKYSVPDSSYLAALQKWKDEASMQNSITNATHNKDLKDLNALLDQEFKKMFEAASNKTYSVNQLLEKPSVIADLTKVFHSNLAAIVMARNLTKKTLNVDGVPFIIYSK